MAVLGFASSLLVVQIGRMLTGIPGINYAFTIVLAIETSFSLLMYEGRRWRFFLQMTLFAILIIPTNLGGPPFDILARINMIINAFLCDLAFNSIYRTFQKRNKLVWWVIIAMVTYWVLNPFISILIKPLFYPPEYIETLISVVSLLLPVIIIESIAGGYFGHKIYRRLKSIHK